MFDDEAVRENSFQFRAELKASPCEFRIPVALDARQGTAHELLVGQTNAAFDPSL